MVMNAMTDPRRIDPETGLPRSVFRIPEEKFPDFEKKVAALSKRAERHLGHPLRAIPFSYDMIKDQRGRARKIIEVIFTCDFVIKQDGWTFVARIDHSNDAGNIIRIVPNTGSENNLGAYRDRQPICEHCNVKRLRRDTFVLRCDATGETKQVGRSCLNEFLGHDVMKVALAAELLGLAGETARGYAEGGLADYRYIELPLYLAHCACMVRRFGWMSRGAADKIKDAGGEAETTSARAMINMGTKPGYRDEPTEEDVAFAEAARRWAASFRDKAELSDWEHNVAVLAEAEFVEPRSLGMAASIVGAYARHVGRLAEQQKLRLRLRDSRPVGEVGERIKPVEATLIGFRIFDSAWGETYMHRFVTTDGNLLVWFASKDSGVEVGGRVRIKGTVKKHDERDDIASTVLTRCVVEALPDEQPAA